jgi:hypothetical protein
MKRFIAEGALPAAASSAPGKKLRSKMVWTDRAPTGCCFAFAPSTWGPLAGLAISLSALKPGLGVAIETLAADRGPCAYLRLDDGIETALSWGEDRRCDEGDGWRRVPNALKTIRAAAHICRASSKEINNRIAQIITIGPDRSFSAKPTELYAASASARTAGCQPTDNGSNLSCQIRKS